MSSYVANGTAQDILSSNHDKGKQTFIIPLTFPDITEAKGVLERIGYGGDIWELRVDLLHSVSTQDPIGSPSLSYVASQLEFLQQASDLPILFTIRTVSQGGKFPDDGAKEALDLMLMAVEKGCAYIDVECTWPASLKEEISARKKITKVVASFHDWTGNIRWSGAHMDPYIKATQFGDILKISIMAVDIADCHEQALFVRNYKAKNTKPILAVGMGAAGQLSRVISPVSLVTHPLMPMPSAPGQLSFAQVNQCLHLIGQLPKREFVIFGHNIAHSLSPTIHNAAFAELGLPHHYSIYETPQIDENVRKVLHKPTFGGASVTYPHKLSIHSELDSISQSATQLRAVNTVIVEDGPAGRKLKGDNTDWLGILRCIEASNLTSYQSAVVIGAGGAARAAVFALQHLKVPRIAVVNRTRATAERLAADFPSLNLKLYESLTQAPAADVIIGCIPADDIKEDDIPDHIFADGPGLVIEMAYRPLVTALMAKTTRQAEWVVVNGVDVLKKQACAQFELWINRRAPVLAIEEALEKRKAAVA